MRLCLALYALMFAFGAPAAVAQSNVLVVQNLAALKAVTTSTGLVALRMGYTTAGDGGEALYAFNSTACSIGGGSGDNGSQVMPSTGGGCWLAQFNGNFPVAAFGAVGNAFAGSPTDDTTALSAALAACGLAVSGGATAGSITYGPKQYLFSGTLSIPSGCTLTGPSAPPFQYTAINYRLYPSLVSTGVTAANVHVQSGSRLRDVLLLTTAVQPAAPLTWRAAMNVVAGFIGTGIVADGDDGIVENVSTLGFVSCFSSTNHNRLTLRHFRGDCTNGIAVNNSQDWTNIDDAEVWPALTEGGTTISTNLFTITSVANNGSGLVRLTMTAQSFSNTAYSPPVTGDKLAVWGVSGVAGANGDWTVTCITCSTGSSTIVVDLQGSTFSGAYTSGGTAGWSIAYRQGTAYYFAGSTAVTMVSANEYGHLISLSANSGSLGIICSSCGFDDDPNVNDQARSGWVVSSAYETLWNGGYVAGKGIPWLLNGNSSSRPDRIDHVNVTLPSSPPQYPLQLNSGNVILTGNAVSGVGGLQVLDTLTSANLTGNYMPGIAVHYQSAPDEGKVLGAGNTFSASGNPCCKSQYQASASFAGGSMSAGQSVTATTSVAGVAGTMSVSVSVQIDPGAGFIPTAWVSALGVVTVRVTALAAGTFPATTYNVSVSP